jgi:hypothetical protein
VFVLAAFAAATVAIGALAAAPSASAVPLPPVEQTASCRLNTSLGLMIYPHMSQITVIGSDHKQHTYLCNNGSWQEVKTRTTPSATFVGSLSTVLTRA